MKTVCERCKCIRECMFYGKPANVETNESQSGCWICSGCVNPLIFELDDAIQSLEDALKDDENEN